MVARNKFLEDSQTYFFPPDPTEMTAHLGGAVVANASGARSYRFKAMRNWVQRIRVVLANGDVLDIRRGEVIAKERVFVIELSDGTKLDVTIPDTSCRKRRMQLGSFLNQTWI